MIPGSFLGRHHLKIFFGCWLLLNLVQAAATGLFDDEAYYWVYSRFLDWGYFDHPPMIALLIKMGYAIFPNEFGIRFFVAIISTATIWLIRKLLDQKDDQLFYSIAISIALLQLGGMIAVPDVPLLFFTTVFFLSYKHFVANPSVRNSVFTGVAIALMLYSKYHGLLVIAFTLMSNPKLLVKPKTYIVAATAALCLAPHIFWQYANGFPSFQYHLKERIESSYDISYSLEYLLLQLLFVGPVASVVLLWSAYRRKPANELERALKFCCFGFLGFFLLYTLRGNVEANWTFPAYIGLMVLSHQYLVTRQHLRKLVNTLAIITFCIVCACRAYFAGLTPAYGIKQDEFFFNRDWATQIQKNANGLQVFFIDSYQRAAKYWFYTGAPTYSLNTLDYRRNGFNFWQMEDSLFHKKMYGVYQGKHEKYFPDTIQTRKGLFLGKTFEDYFSFARVRLISQGTLSGKQNEKVGFQIRTKLDDVSLACIHPAFDTARIWIGAYTIDVDEPIIIPTTLTLKELVDNEQKLSGSVMLQLPKGNYTLRFGITSCIDNWPTINSSVSKLKVE